MIIFKLLYFFGDNYFQKVIKSALGPFIAQLYLHETELPEF